MGLLGKTSSRKFDSCHRAFRKADSHPPSLITMLERTVLNLPMKVLSDSCSLRDMVHRSVSFLYENIVVFHEDI